MRNTFAGWMTGYVTAYNAWVRSKVNIAEGTDGFGVMAWVDNYCAKAPLDNVATAAIKLIQHLKSR
jgi:hypothetical protein